MYESENSMNDDTTGSLNDSKSDISLILEDMDNLSLYDDLMDTE